MLVKLHPLFKVIHVNPFNFKVQSRFLIFKSCMNPQTNRYELEVFDEGDYYQEIARHYYL